MFRPMCCYQVMLVTFLLLLLDKACATKPSPNIVIILADDLGWNDVSFHGSNQFPTPNIDALAYSGIILQDYYTQPLCTPARAALLTGRHPIHNGMEHNVIFAPQPWGVPLSDHLLSQYLQSQGYVTRGVGKWHLGFYKSDYTPTRRGFDSFYGSWLGHQNHFTHMAYETHPGYDLHRDLNVSWEGYGRYAADLFTEEAESIINTHDVQRPLFLYLSHTAPHSPIQAPQDTVDKLHYVRGRKRRTYAAMVTKVDESVGRVTKALKERNMLNNSIILFLSDNGGATHGFNSNVASNYPLRGSKDTLWEGGVRGVGLIWSPLLQGVPRVHHGLVNVQDWLPTLLTATGFHQLEDLKNLDGVSQWAALNNQAPAPYNTMLHNIDPKRKIAALRHGDWKVVVGTTHRRKYDGWYGRLRPSQPQNAVNLERDSMAGKAVESTSSPVPEPQVILGLRKEATISCMPKKRVKQIRISRTEKKLVSLMKSEDIDTIFTTSCKPHRAPCLFNIAHDPCELNNVAASHQKVVRRMLRLLQQYRPVKPHNRHTDRRSFPQHWNNTWTTWQDFV